MRKKFLTAAGVAALCLGLLVSAAAGEEVKLTWSTWLGGDQLEVLKARIEEFEKQNPGITVEILSVAGGYGAYKSKLLAMVATDTAPDVAHTVIYDAPFFIREGLLYDVTRFAEEIDSEEYFISDAYVDRGRVWGGYESHVQVYPIYYNIDLFNAAGLPSPNDLAATGEWTWPSFLEAARKLTRVGSGGVVEQYGVFLHPVWEVGWGPFLLSNGASFINESRDEIVIDSPEALEALRFFTSLYTEEGVTPKPGTPLPSGDPLLNGSAAMTLNGSWMMNRYKQIAGNVSWDIAPTPRGSTDWVYRGPGADGVVLAGTDHPEEAWKLVRFFLGEYVQMDKARSKLEVPVLKSAIASDVYLQPPPVHMQVIGDLLNRSVAQPVFLGAVEVRTAIEQALVPAFSGEIPVEEAVVQAKTLGGATLMEFLGE